MEPRVVSSLLVGALLRLAESQGGFGAILAKGDPTAGSVLVILLERGAGPRCYERLLHPDGSYGWEESRQQPADEQALRDFLARRRQFDPDLWIVELDIASAERFAAEMKSVG
jgi:hypothetical protein